MYLPEVPRYLHLLFAKDVVQRRPEVRQDEEQHGGGGQSQCPSSTLIFVLENTPTAREYWLQ